MLRSGPWRTYQKVLPQIGTSSHKIQQKDHNYRSFLRSYQLKKENDLKPRSYTESIIKFTSDTLSLNNLQIFQTRDNIMLDSTKTFNKEISREILAYLPEFNLHTILDTFLNGEGCIFGLFKSLC